MRLGQMGNKAHRSLDGVSYRISQDMVHFREKGWGEWIATKVFARYIALPILTVLAPVWYLLLSNFSWAREIMGQITWIFTPWLDQALGDVKRELVKDVSGKRVLDVGSAGAGDWLKYLNSAAEVVELEPDPYHLKVLIRVVDRFRAENPNVPVEIVNKPLEMYSTNDPYDVVILGNVLCQTCDSKNFLQEVDRVLKPGGKVIFQEHIREAPGTFVGLLQDAFNYWWPHTKGRCNCNKNPAQMLRSVGKWQVEAWDLRIDGAVIFDRIAVGIAQKSKIP